MGLFGNKKPALAALISESDFDEVGNYSSTIAYLEGLSIEDYAKVLKVAGICRQANEDCAAALGMPLEPTTFINPPIVASGTFDEPKFLDDITRKPSKKIKVKE